ncbi:hypothetical protein ACSZME_17625 [Aeromonas dhakensis]
MKGAIGWLITKDEPTAEQREEVRKYGKQQVKTLSFMQFQQAIIDVSQYLQSREQHFFGSVKDPHTGNIKTSIEYIPLDLIDIKNESSYEINDIAEGLASGQSFSLLGDYGAGKSMTLRQIFFI